MTNKYNGIFMDGVFRHITGNVTWSNTEVPYVLYMNSLLVSTLSTGASLTLGDNVVLKVLEHVRQRIRIFISQPGDRELFYLVK